MFPPPNLKTSCFGRIRVKSDRTRLSRFFVAESFARFPPEWGGGRFLAVNKQIRVRKTVSFVNTHMVRANVNGAA